jgi:hypothetical protein
LAVLAEIRQQNVAANTPVHQGADSETSPAAVRGQKKRFCIYGQSQVNIDKQALTVYHAHSPAAWGAETDDS